MRKRLSRARAFHILVVALAGGWALVCACANAAPPAFVGRPVAEILIGAREQGLNVVFSTALVPADLRVLAEPEATHGLALLEEILAQHDLALRKFGPETYAVTRRAARGESPATDSRELERSPGSANARPVLEELVVTTSRYALGESVQPSHTVVSAEALRTMPRLAEESLKAVQRLPGLATNGVAGLLPVRGGAPDETVILLDGLVLYEPFHLKNFLAPVSLLDASFIGSLEFLSGGFGSAYGDRMSAVIDARSAAPGDLPRYELGLSLFHVNGLASGTLDDDRVRWVASLRQSNLGRVLQALETDLGNPEYGDGFLRAEYAASDNTDLAINVLGSRDEISVNWERTHEDARAYYRNAYVWSTLDHTWANGVSSRLVASFTDVHNSRQGQVNDPGRTVGQVRERRDFEAASLDVSFSVEGPYGLHEWGAELSYLTAQYDYASAGTIWPLTAASSPVDAERDLAVSPEGWKYAAYWSGRFHVTDELIAELGLRLEEQEYTAPEHSTQVGPRLSMLYSPRGATQWRASWGRYSQSERINELRIEDGVVDFGPAQHAEHFVLSVDHAWTPRLTMRIEAYRKNYSDLHTRYENLFNPLVLLPELQPDRVAISPSSAQVDGVEVSFAWEGDELSGWFAYTWSEADDVVDGVETPRSWDQTHAVSAGLRWQAGPWDITLADTWHTGWPITEASLAYGADGTPILEPDIRNAARLGSYNSLDLRVSRLFPLAHGELEAYLEVTNLLNAQNACCVDYRITSDDGTPAFTWRTYDWLGIVPSIGVRWRY